ncbi:uncharacterized protein VTP21DRAFT_3487 [Calcarisporiella thermophila]|uniref:uncharacterized protein n=1 Tax=Calcarisporiella thermophila TaxID=911321 RepID=UPI003743FEFF
MIDSRWSITNSNGKRVSLLNEEHYDSSIPQFSPQKACILSVTNVSLIAHKKKYFCSYPDCDKSFTTSGHLARHHRIHTGEKNYACLMPGCNSRFSRKDNMWQHYRTHFSAKSRQRPRTKSNEFSARYDPVKQEEVVPESASQIPHFTASAFG